MRFLPKQARLLPVMPIRFPISMPLKSTGVILIKVLTKRMVKQAWDQAK